MTDPKLDQLVTLARLRKLHEDTKMARLTARRSQIEAEIAGLRTSCPEPLKLDEFVFSGGWERARLWRDAQLLARNSDLASLRAEIAEQMPASNRATARFEIARELKKRTP
ncbi:hypothetical protein AB0T83_04060 [Fluviibacterium sp. DFM31]|uniref:DUF222 domain-containing protein n=1 Tax=Meridianimarinicoccus marinus TaxID=3231483 RepID=A0ABV3L364_9RHOB